MRLFVTNLIAILLLCSCSTILSVTVEGFTPGSKIYSGTRANIDFMAGNDGPGFFNLREVLWPFALIDLPLCLAADTLLLPYTLTDTLIRQSAQPDRIPQSRIQPYSSAPLPQEQG